MSGAGRKRNFLHLIMEGHFPPPNLLGSLSTSTTSDRMWVEVLPNRVSRGMTY